MHQHVHPHAPVPKRRHPFSLSHQGVAVRLALAAVLVAIVWALILPLVA